jgi:hypothetical protein
MPSHSIHLLAAYKYDPAGSAEFYAGNIAPDAVRDRVDKDRTHLRNLPASEQPDALAALAMRLDLSLGENLGALLHIYTDLLWDASHLKRFAESYGEGWFIPHRRQTAIAGAWIFHNNPEIRRIWKLVADAVEGGLSIDIGAITCGCIRAECHKECGAECGDVKGMILYNYRWNIENYTGPSPVFPPDEVDEFAARTAESFTEFLRGIGVGPSGW